MTKSRDIAKGRYSSPGLRQGKKRRMRKFMINELSAVDAPAQEGARALLLKRNDVEKDFEEDRVIVLLTSAEDGHTHAVWMHPGMRGGQTSFGSNPESEDDHDHPWILNADGTITIGENDGHTHTVDPQQIFEMVMAQKGDAEKRRHVLVSSEKLWDDYAVKLDTPEEDDTVPEPKTPTAEDLKTANDRAEKAEGERDELKDKLERTEKVAALTPEQRAHFDSLDEDGKTAFLGKSADERQAILTKAAEDDAVVYTDSEGTEFRKSDDPRLIAMAKRADADRKRTAQLEAVRTQEGFEKRAEETLGNLPGEVKVRAAIVQAIDGIEDEDVRKAAHESVQAGDKAVKAAFSTLGDRTGVTETDAEKELDALARKRHADPEFKGSYYDAYDAVSQENPELAKRAVQGN